MSEAEILFITKEALTLVLILSLPPIIVASLLGVVVSLIQAITQVQEQTLSFAIKLLGVTVTLVVTATWLGRELLLYANNLFTKVATLSW
ncbi:MAG: type III secretion system export apparatus subunit SctS [Planctomycetota bacterium]|jgi:type III secretion HrpO family protein|nr:type III secretion system export apparatus subunit SctS [Planctomycetota bacterium]